MTNVQIKLTESSDLITRYTADFVGQEWLPEKVNGFLHQDGGDHYLELTERGQ